MDNLSRGLYPTNYPVYLPGATSYWTDSFFLRDRGLLKQLPPRSTTDSSAAWVLACGQKISRVHWNKGWAGVQGAAGMPPRIRTEHMHNYRSSSPVRIDDTRIPELCIRRQPSLVFEHWAGLLARARACTRRGDRAGDRVKSTVPSRELFKTTA